MCGLVCVWWCILIPVCSGAGGGGRGGRGGAGDEEQEEGEEGGLGYHTSHSESLEVTERMEVPVSARSVRLDTLVVGLAAVDGDSAELCVGQPGSASERMPLGPMAWCWSLQETESSAYPDTAATPPGSSKRPPGPQAAGSGACRRLRSPASSALRPSLPPPTPLSAFIPSSKCQAAS